MPASWKGYDTPRSLNMNYFCVPGRLQLRYYNHLKKLGIDPHNDIRNYMEMRLAELGINVKLEELYKLRENIDVQIKELEENSNTKVVNKFIQKDIKDRISSLRAELKWNRLPSELNIFYSTKNTALKHEISYNEFTDLLKEQIIKEIKGESKNKVLDRIEKVRSKANNGILTDAQAQEAFKKSAEA